MGLLEWEGIAAFRNVSVKLRQRYKKLGEVLVLVKSWLW